MAVAAARRKREAEPNEVQTAYGKGIPVFAPEKIKETQPDYILILPWNLKEEIMQQMETNKQ